MQFRSHRSRRSIANALRAATTVAGSAALLTLLSDRSVARGQVTTWIGGSPGGWNSGANWSGGVAPNGMSFDVRVDDDPARVSLVGVPTNTSVGSLSIGANDEVSLGSLTVGAGGLHNSGLINSMAGNLPVWLSLAGGVARNDGTIRLIPMNASHATLSISADTTLAGSGTVIFYHNASSLGTGQNYVRGNGTSRLINNQTILGYGTAFGTTTLGSQLQVTNNGTIRAADVVPNFVITPGGGSDPANAFVNNGTIAGCYVLSGAAGGQFNNSNGTIAGPSGFLSAGAVINGGTMIGRCTAISATLVGVHLVPSGSDPIGLDVGTGGTLNLADSIVNDARVLVRGRVLAAGTVMISGGGSIDVSGGSVNGASGSRLVNVSNRLNGFGNIGANTIAVSNAGTISAGPVVLFDPLTGTLTLDPANVADAFLNTGTLAALGGATLLLSGNGGGTFDSSAGTIVVASNGTLVNSATLKAGPLSLAGTASQQSAATFTTVAGAGTFINGANASTSLAHVRVGTLSIAAGGTVTLATNGSDAGTSRIASVPAINGRLDMADNDLVVAAPDSRSAVEAMVASGRNGGAWDGVGIISSAARANTATGLGVLSGADYTSIGGGTGTFSGQAYAPTDTLVKYTWNGDANFSGTVTFDDYVRINTGFNAHLTGWANGDFNYDGVVNFDDYVLIDIAFNAQNGTLSRAVDWISGDDRNEQGSGRTDFGELPSGLTSMSSVESSLRVEDSRAATRVEMVVEHFEQFGNDYARSFLASIPEPSALWFASGLVLARRSRRRDVDRYEAGE